MTDPTAAAATAASAGIGALILATLGVEPQALLWGAVGASIGITVAPKSGRARAVLMFGAVVLLSALFGTYLAHAYMGNSVVARNACAGALGALFHPLFSAAVAGLPNLITRLTDRIAGGPTS